MKRGRVSVLAIFVVLGLAILGGVLAFSSTADSPESVSIRFMDALARNNPEVLADVTYVEDEPKAELLEKWKESCRFNAHYRFKWTMKGTNTLSDKSAVATINMFGIGQSADQDFRIPLVKHDGRWYIDLAVVDRNFFPSLPQ
jgi:hypothetical protein